MTDRNLQYDDPVYYTNRELSWLQFNRRCLSEARNKENPLFERLNFLSITQSNLDEFFMVRIASLQDMVDAGYKKKDIAGMTASQQLSSVLTDTHNFVSQQYWTYSRMLLPELKANGIYIIRNYGELDNKEIRFLDNYYNDTIFPVLTPMAVDASRPFPLIRNKSLNLGAILTRKKNADPGILGRTKKGKKAGKNEKEEYEFATVQVPSGLPRVIVLPQSERGIYRLVLLEDVIRHHMGSLFLNYDVRSVAAYRIMRNADMDIDEDEAEDLLKEIEKQLKKRKRGAAIKLEVETGIDPRMKKFLQNELSLEDEKVFFIEGPLDLTVLSRVYDLEGFDELREHRYAKPQEIALLPDDCNIFDQVRDHDVFLAHPFQKFTPVVRFVEQAAVDPDVLAIKQTLYRVSGHSPIIRALAKAAENGKQVTVLVELKARFDEENNIVWARMLEKAGCHVIYGLVGLKTHSKITLVVRREEDGIRRYVHLATGNYNDSTAKHYTDVGLMTCREPIGEDATAVFNMLSGYSEPRNWNCLVLAPIWLKERFLYLIGRERRHAENGENGHIIAKMNSLCDKEVINALYEASAAGVKIELIVRGICCLKVGIPGVSENITVRSIVGNFLEHSRIYFFENDGKPEIYASSADWMPRNLDRRVEIMFPLEDESIFKKAYHILEVELKDTVKAQILRQDGTYERVDRRGKELIDSQLVFCNEAVAEAQSFRHSGESRVFIPREPSETEEE